jgi:hypothetical protein
MLQALQTLQPCKNTGQNGGVSTKRIMLTTGNWPSGRLPSVHAARRVQNQRIDTLPSLKGGDSYRLTR